MDSVPTPSCPRLPWRLAALLALTLAALLAVPSVALAQSASLTATRNADWSVDLTLSDGPNDWWFRINSWGTCTPASGTTFSNIRGYGAGTHSVWAYADGNLRQPDSRVVIHHPDRQPGDDGEQRPLR